jgi:hypothetical protein
LVPKPATEEEFAEDGRDELTLDTGASAFFVEGLCLLSCSTATVIGTAGHGWTGCRVYARPFCADAV